MNNESRLENYKQTMDIDLSEIIEDKENNRVGLDKKLRQIHEKINSDLSNTLGFQVYNELVMIYQKLYYFKQAQECFYKAIKIT